MLIISLTRIIKTSLNSLWRNRWLSIAAILIMILTLATISFFTSLLIITNKTTKTLESRVDISVYFLDTASKDQIFSIQNILLSRSDIKSVDYISKERALQIWRNRNKENPKLRDIITEASNPLPRSLEIKTNKAEDLERINDFLGTDDYKPLIKEISYQKNRDLINRLVRITSFVKIIGWSLSLIFLLISILIIYNTIRLTIYARSGEIEIMKLVGASDWYVQGPFFVEGLSYGLVASIITAVILYFTFYFSLPATESYLGLTDLNSTYLGLDFWAIAVIQLIVGALLGTGCSLLAVKKHLKEKIGDAKKIS